MCTEKPKNTNVEPTQSAVSVILYGRICPRCGRVNSPYTTQCPCFNYGSYSIQWICSY